MLILLPCRLCAARNDPGQRRQAAGLHLPTWKLCLLVALPVATAALLAALIVLACRRRNQNASVAAAPPAAQNREKKQVDKPNQWSTHLWSSMSSPRNPMSINPTMVRSAHTTPSPHRPMDTEPDQPPPPPPFGESPSYSTIFADLVASSLELEPEPPPAGAGRASAPTWAVGGAGGVSRPTWTAGAGPSESAAADVDL
jgi:hypothetical protein